MPTTMNQTMLDPEMDSIAQARLYAKTLRDTSEKNIEAGKNGRMVGPYWIANDDRNDLLKQGMAGGLEYVGGQAASDLGAQREQQFQTALQNRPSMTMDQTVPGTPAVTQEFPGADAFGGEGSAPVTAELSPAIPESVKQVRKPYTQLQDEYMNWGTDLAKIRHPLAQAIATKGIQGMMDIPEQGLAREEKAADAQRLEEARNKDRLAQIVAAQAGRPVPAPHVITSTDDKGNVSASVRNPDGTFTTQNLGPLGKTKTAMGGGGGEGLGKTQSKGMTLDGRSVIFSPTKGVHYTRDAEGKLEVYNGVVVPMGQAAKPEMLAIEAKDSLPKIDGLIAKTKANPDAFGVVPAIASLTGNFIGSRITSAALSPEERAARVAVMREAVVLINKIYGAALSRGEGGRANTWAPAPDDDYDSTMAKLLGAKAYATELASSKGGAAPAATAGTAPKRKKYNQATEEFE